MNKKSGTGVEGRQKSEWVADGWLGSRRRWPTVKVSVFGGGGTGRRTLVRVTVRL